MPISPFPYLDRMRGKRVLLVYARYDLTFPVELSRMLVDEFRRRGIEHQLAVLPCGHYSTGVTPFKWLDGLTLCRFLAKTSRLFRGASPLGLPYTRPRAPLRRRAPVAWLARTARSLLGTSVRFMRWL